MQAILKIIYMLTCMLFSFAALSIEMEEEPIEQESPIQERLTDENFVIKTQKIEGKIIDSISLREKNKKYVNIFHKLWTNVEFNNAYIERFNFTGLTTDKNTAIKGTLNNVNFISSSIDNTKFTGNFIKVHFIDSIIKDSAFNEVTFKKSNFMNHSKLENVIFNRCVFSDGFSFNNAYLIDVSFTAFSIYELDIFDKAKIWHKGKGEYVTLTKGKKKRLKRFIQRSNNKRINLSTWLEIDAVKKDKKLAESLVLNTLKKKVKSEGYSFEQGVRDAVLRKHGFYVLKNMNHILETINTDYAPFYNRKFHNKLLKKLKKNLKKNLRDDYYKTYIEKFYKITANKLREIEFIRPLPYAIKSSVISMLNGEEEIDKNNNHVEQLETQLEDKEKYRQSIITFNFIENSKLKELLIEIDEYFEYKNPFQFQTAVYNLLFSDEKTHNTDYMD